MKFFPALILAISIGTSAVFAGDPQFKGEVLYALEENSPRIRCGMVIGALENAKTDRCDRYALQIIADDFFRHNAIDKILLERLIALWQKNPADLHLGDLCCSVAAYRNYRSESLDKAIRSALSAAMPEDPEYNRIFVKIIINGNTKLLNSGKTGESAALFDKINKKWEEQPYFLYISAIHAVHCMFYENDTAPGMKNFDKIPADNQWNLRCQHTAAMIRKCEPVYGEDAVYLINAALLLRMPETAELLKKYSAAFPTENWTPVSIMAAIHLKQKDLYIPSFSEPETILHNITIGNYLPAKRMIKKLDNRDLQNEFNIIINSHMQRHRKALKLYHDGKFSSSDTTILSAYTILSVLNSASITKDTAAVGKIVDEIYAQKNRKPELANAAGYVAAELNMKLDKAEHLIREALKSAPQNPAYLDSMAWVLYRQQKFTEAEKFITAALRFRIPDHSMSTLLLHCAAIKAKLQKTTEAKAFLIRAKNMYDPDTKNNDYPIELQKKLEETLK